MNWPELLALAIVTLFLLGCVGMVVDVKRHCRDVAHQAQLDDLWDDREATPVVTVMPSGEAS